MAIELNYDVLALILAVIPTRDDLLSLMNTCKTLYKAGVPSLLQDGVDIKTARTMQSLHQFLFADKSRFQNLIDLTFNGSVEPALANEILQHTTRLAKLSIWDWAGAPEGGHWLVGQEASFSQLRQTVQNLTSLRSFALSSYQDNISADTFRHFLTNFHSPLIKLRLYTVGESPSNSTELDLYDLMAPYSHSLKEVTFGGYGNLRNPNAHQFSSLRSLILYPYGEATIYIQTLVYAFPNLRELYVNRQSTGILTRQSLRGPNQAAQRFAKWDSLDLLGGAILELFDLGIACPVYRLNLRPSMFASTGSHMDKLRQLLEDTHARDIEIEHSCADLPAILDVLRGVPPGVASIVKITADIHDAGLHLNSVLQSLDTLSSGPAVQPMSYLRITLREQDMMTVRAGTEMSVENALKKLDIAGYGERIAQHNPSLKQLVLQISHHPTYCLEVSGEGEHRKTTALSAQAGYEPLARLGLISGVK